MGKVELSDKLDISEELVLNLHQSILMVVHSVSLTSIFGLFLKDFKIALSKDLFVHFAAVIEQFCAESTEFEIDWLGSLTLRL